MTKDNCFELGKITKTHGLKGEVVLWLDVDFPEDYEDLESVFLDMKGELVPFFMNSYRLSGNRAIVQFEDIDTFEKAEAMVNLEAFLPLEELPELENDQFYYHEIIGFQIKDKNELPITSKTSYPSTFFQDSLQNVTLRELKKHSE